MDSDTGFESFDAFSGELLEFLTGELFSTDGVVLIPSREREGGSWSRDPRGRRKTEEGWDIGRTDGWVREAYIASGRREGAVGLDCFQSDVDIFLSAGSVNN